MKKITLLLLSLGVLFSAQSQIEEKINREGVVPGSITLKKKEILGYIKTKNCFCDTDEEQTVPWEFQSKIQFITKDIFENKEKIKSKDYTKYTAKDIDGYKYNNDSLVYVSAKYADMSAVGAGMIPKVKFMRIIAEGEISLFYHYQNAPGTGETSELKRLRIEYRTPDLVYRKGESGKLKLLNGINISEVMADCPSVVEKYNAGTYGGVGNDETKSKVAQLANRVLTGDNAKSAAVLDYNETCKK